MTNGNLPVEQLADGEGTVIAGTPNRHLNLRNALGCIIGRAYFVQAFMELNAVDRAAYFDAYDLRDLAVLTAMVVDDIDDFMGLLGYSLIVKGPTTIDDFVGVISAEVVRVHGASEDEQIAFAVMLAEYWETTLEPLINPKEVDPEVIS